MNFVNMICDRILLRLSRTPHFHLPNLLTPHQYLPFPCAIPTCDHIWTVRGNLFPNGIGESCSGCQITKGMTKSRFHASWVYADIIIQQAAGAFNLALCIPIWHIFIAQILDAVDFPIALPVGDLSTVILGKSQKARKREVEGQN